MNVLPRSSWKYENQRILKSEVSERNFGQPSQYIQEETEAWKDAVTCHGHKLFSSCALSKYLFSAPYCKALLRLAGDIAVYQKKVLKLLSQ